MSRLCSGRRFELILDRVVDARQFAQEGVVVEGQPLITSSPPTARAAQHAGLPQRVMVRRTASSCSASSSGRQAQAVALVEQSGDLHAGWLRMLLRCTSVGCAVSTGTTSASRKKPSISSAGTWASSAFCRALASVPSRVADRRRWRVRGRGGCGAGPRRCSPGAGSS
jgi:hypothetical protein